MFATGLGMPYLQHNVTRSFKRLLAKANLPANIRFHDLRHAAATNSLQADVPLKVVSERLGHSTLAITADLYTHRVASLEADAGERLASLYHGATEKDTYPTRRLWRDLRGWFPHCLGIIAPIHLTWSQVPEGNNVPRRRIELRTRGFSVRCSTN